MQPNAVTPQPSQVTKKQSINIVLLVIAAILIVVGGVYLYEKKPSKNSKTVSNTYIKGLHNEDYSQLDSYHLLGVGKGNGMSFSKPVMYRLAVEGQDHQQASFSHSLKAPTFAPLGALHVATVASATETSPAMLDSMAKTLKDPKSQSYKAMVAATQDFVSVRFSPLYDITYQPARPLQGNNLKGRAWALDLSATPKKTGDKTTNQNGVPSNGTDPSKAQPVPKAVAAGFENYKGTAILIVGKKTFYYFVIYNTDYNWHNNSAVWQQIENSIKVDQ